MWKRWIVVLAFSLAIVTCYAGDSEDAETAYRKGDYKTTVKLLLPLAKRGDASAQFNLGLMYANGKGVPQNDKAAVEWYRKAAEQGHAVAQYNLGIMYYKGEGVHQDDKEAVKWIRKAAQQGHVSAQFNLGTMYHKGERVHQDDKEAVKWYRKAAEQGDASAQFNLGAMYHKGEGVRQDDKEAVKWYRKAAEQGLAVAQSNLGVMYNNGRGIPQDHKAAVKWYRKAAKQGLPKAQRDLGYMYESGSGVIRDYVQSYKWYNLAAAGGNNYALKRRDEIAKSMTTSQITEAQTMSSSISTNGDSSYAAVNRSLVWNIQSHLKKLGYDPGPVDGAPGRRTTAAVKAFQREWDIQPDGILSSTLLKVLKITLEANSKSDQPTNKAPSFAGSGSGFTVGRDYVVTNHHVVDGCSKLVVYINGNPVAGSVVASSDADDLALIKLTELTPDQARFRASGRAQLGEDVWVVGYPLRTLLASGLNVVSGGISALAGLGNNVKIIQISAPVQLGNSGGPLLDSSGNVVGVVVSKLDAKKFADAIGDIPQNINFAIKGAVVKSFLDVHGIDYQTDSSEVEMHGEEIAAKARKFTVPVECYK